MAPKLCERCRRLQTKPAKGKGWTIHHGPAQQMLQRIDDSTIAAFITDPPYASGAGTMIGALAKSSTKYQNSESKKLPELDGDSMLPEAWSAMMLAVAHQMRRVAMPGADVLMFCDWRSLSRLIEVLGGAGFGLRGTATWNKGNAARPNRNGFRSQTELILHARAPGKLDRPSDVYLPGVFEHRTIQNGKLHMTQKPLELMRELVEIAPPGATILDPFQGAATTGLAAIESGRRYIGCESSAEYHAIATDRLRNRG
ncbi:DNA-methyltransferase [Aureliella helgolandensis]|uniref:Methyltransferase n=1 Tax=Aureliella helgolandensis TaxID=2527968 RepID=A0A518G720_9BACT|nr:site-specific DNA-methyltransferase [Aureliella helgolandensis]QDV24384.1 Modification methylase HindIII [Aureliella helgolandensis]